MAGRPVAARSVPFRSPFPHSVYVLNGLAAPHGPTMTRNRHKPRPRRARKEGVVKTRTNYIVFIPISNLRRLGLGTGGEDATKINPGVHDHKYNLNN